MNLLFSIDRRAPPHFQPRGGLYRPPRNGAIVDASPYRRIIKGLSGPEGNQEADHTFNFIAGHDKGCS
jgi:hypothetical protein